MFDKIMKWVTLAVALIALAVALIGNAQANAIADAFRKHIDESEVINDGFEYEDDWLQTQIDTIAFMLEGGNN